MSPAPLRVEPEVGRKGRRAFIDVPYRLNRDEPAWVPPLRMGEAKLMDRRANPFFRFGTAQHFLAWRGSRVVGRVAAIENPRHNEFHEDRIGFFGFFDVESDPEAAARLVEAADAWIADRGLGPLRGPVSYTTNDTCGVLIEGFEEPPALLMPWNRPDYDSLLRGAGLVKAKDLLALHVSAYEPLPERWARVIQRRMERSSTVLRRIDLGRFDEERKVLKNLYNRCWERNWGFVPATDAEFEHAADDLKMVLDANMSSIAMRGEDAVGFSIFLKDINRILLHGPRNGRLFPTLWWKLLRGLKRPVPTRCVLLGVVPEARGGAIAEAMIAHVRATSRQFQMPFSECGWVLEDNEKMLAPILQLGGEVRKRYRIYESPTERVRVGLRGEASPSETAAGGRSPAGGAPSGP